MTRFRHSCGHISGKIAVPAGAMCILHEGYAKIPCRKCAKQQARDTQSRLAEMLYKRGNL